MLIALSVANFSRKRWRHPHSDEDLSGGAGRDGNPQPIPFQISDRELRRAIAYFTTFVSMVSHYPYLPNDATAT